MRGERDEDARVRPALHLFSGSHENVAADVARLRDMVADANRPIAVHRPAGPDGDDACRLAVVASGADDLRGKLAKALARLEGRADAFSFPQGIHGRRRGGRFSGKVAFLFPGQGSHRVGMVETVSRGYPGAWAYWEAADRALADRLPAALSDCVFQDGHSGRRGVEALAGTDVAQPAIGVANAVVNHVLTDLGLRADMHAGHSYGEYAALHAAGWLDFVDLVELSEARGRAIEQACGAADGAMLAVGAEEDRVARLCREIGGVVVANVNGPAQTVAAGAAARIADLASRCAAEGVRATRLSVRTAFHSPIVAPAREPLRAALAGVAFRPGAVPVYANATAEPHGRDPDAVRDALADHLVSPVRFLDSVRNMYRDGARCFVEVGPGSTLASLASSILKDVDDALAVAVDHPDGWFGLLNALARLFVAGVPWSVARLDERLAAGDRPGSRPPEHPAAGAVVRPAAAERSDAAPAATLLDDPMARHHRLMKLFLESQERVMVAYLHGRTVRPRAVPPTVEPAPAPREGDAPGPAPVTGTHPEPAGADESDVLAAVREIVASLTGYPPDMLDADLDLEADLGIDSIKRVEILVALRERSLLPPGLAEDDMKALAELSTLSRLAAHLASAPAADGVAAHDPPRTEPEAAVEPARRMRVWRRVEPADRRSGEPRTGSVAVAGGDAAFVRALADALPGGLTPYLLDDDASGAPQALVGYVNVRALRPGSAEDGFAGAGARDGLHRLVAELKILEDALRRAHGFVQVAARLGDAGAGADALSAGSAGVAKSVALEWPEVECRVVDAGAQADNAAWAAALAEELHAQGDFREISRAGDLRRALLPTPAPLSRSGAALELDEGDVVLFTGGARGITAEVAAAVAARWRPRLVVLGRTEPGAEEPRYRGLADMAALKHEIATAVRESGRMPSPREVEGVYAAIVRRREVEANLRRLRAGGAEVTYTAVDVGEPAAFAHALAETYRAFGRIDAVVHGAGVVEDRLIGNKTRDSFDRVLRPKVDGALALVGSLRLECLKFLCFFSSTAAVHGNAGQSDYAAANAILNALARSLNERVPGRVVAVNWGPWEAGVGMVTGAMARRFAEQGVPVVAREGAAQAFMDEIRFGPKTDAEVILG